jgi:tetratricopeptide (TPR) repeat protein
VWGALALFVVVCVAGFRAEPSRVVEGEYSRWLGPQSEALAVAGRERARNALESLVDTALPGPERLRRYRSDLGEADRMFAASLIGNPVQAETLAQLAAVRWELDPPAEVAEAAGFLKMIELAAAMAPTVPRVQVQLGELLLRMGRDDAAVDHFRRSIELDSRTAERVVAALRARRFSAERILDRFPASEDVLIALEGPFRDEGLDRAYLEAVERTIDAAPPSSRLLRVAANVCLRADRPERLLELVDRVGKLEDSRSEADRLFARSRARSELGDHRGAIDDAREADRLRPSDAALAEHLGNVLDRAERHAEAIEAYHNALGIVARDPAGSVTRARLYRRIGQTEERRGDAGRAYDAYKMALQAEPGEAIAARRVSEMEHAAGLSRR